MVLGTAVTLRVSVATAIEAAVTAGHSVCRCSVGTRTIQCPGDLVELGVLILGMGGHVVGMAGPVRDWVFLAGFGALPITPRHAQLVIEVRYVEVWCGATRSVGSPVEAVVCHRAFPVP